jgi:hypothetical protein
MKKQDIANAKGDLNKLAELLLNFVEFSHEDQDFLREKIAKALSGKVITDLDEKFAGGFVVGYQHAQARFSPDHSSYTKTQDF